MSLSRCSCNSRVIKREARVLGERHWRAIRWMMSRERVIGLAFVLFEVSDGICLSEVCFLFIKKNRKRGIIERRWRVWIEK